MTRFIKIVALCLVSQWAAAQCDTTGILLELQATTNIQGILLGDDKCLKVLKIGSGLTLSNDTLSSSGGGGGSGTVDTFSSGNLSPLFTTSVANPTTTPAQSFTLSNAGAGTWFGNNTGGSTTPAFNNSGALTKIDDTNVTATLGGSPTTALLNAASITLGWTGTLAVSRGGIGVGTITGLMQGNGTGAVTGITNSSTVGQVLRVTGASTYAWGALDLSDTDAITGDLPLSNLAQGVARSVLGVAGNATADRADIQGTTDQVLRVNTAGTGLGFGQIATGGITDDAVTYAKIQNVVNDERLLGRVSGANGVIEELTQAQAQTFLGITGTANRFAIFPTSTTISTNAAFAFTTGPDRVTFTGSAAGTGANNAFLNLNSGAITGATEFLRMSGNINGNMLATMFNSNNASANNHTLLQLVTGGDASGASAMQFTINGVITHTIGVDNVDNRLKFTPNSALPGGNVGMGVIIRDNSGVGNTGVNNDFPIHPLTVEGRTRSDLFLGEGNMYGSGNINFGNGAGTGPTLTQIVGTGNSVMVRFSTGTVPTASGTIFTITYPTAFLTASMVNFSAGCNNASAVAGDNAATDLLKFKILTSDATTFIFKAVGTLAASTAYALTFNIFGY